MQFLSICATQNNQLMNVIFSLHVPSYNVVFLRFLVIIYLVLMLHRDCMIKRLCFCKLGMSCLCLKIKILRFLIELCFVLNFSKQVMRCKEGGCSINSFQNSVKVSVYLSYYDREPKVYKNRQSELEILCPQVHIIVDFMHFLVYNSMVALLPDLSFISFQLLISETVCSFNQI